MVDITVEVVVVVVCVEVVEVKVMVGEVMVVFKPISTVVGWVTVGEVIVDV